MRIGLLGGGQLARMMAQAGRSLGMEFMFLSPDPRSCAAPFGRHICAPFESEEARRRLAGWADVVSYEFENVPVAVVAALEREVTVHPSAAALDIARDRLKEKRRFRALGIPTAGFAPVNSFADLRAAVNDVGFPAILKTRTEGYDGKGQVVLRGPSALGDAWRQVGGVPCIVEAMVPFERELSIIAVRGGAGEMAFYPVSENRHREGILRLSICRKDDPMQSQAERLIRCLLEHLDYVGVLALELFQVGEELFASEMAPRVHNTGHWTIEGARTSQFENHLRAIGGLPLGETTAERSAAMVNLIGCLPTQAMIRSIRGAIPHFYGKAERPGRKLGHVTLIDDGCASEGFGQRLEQLLVLAGEPAQAGAIMMAPGSSVNESSLGGDGSPCDLKTSGRRLG